MKTEAMSAYLRRQILSWGASLVGFADLRGAASGRLSRWPNAISVGVALDGAAVADLKGGPTREYYDEYQRVNRALNEMTERIAQRIAALGYSAEPYLATIVDSSMGSEYERTLSVGFQHKTAASRAGLGWIGKSSLLITPEYGPRVRLATVLTDMPLEAGSPVMEGRCRNCRACLQACPAGAILGHEWSVGVPREELVDVFSCRAKAKQLLMERVGVEDAVCGVCIAVCPIGMGGGKENTWRVLR